MPEKATVERARKDRREGKSPTTQAGEFVREEMHHIREGKHGAKNAKQAIAIGLSKARRAGVKLPPGKRTSGETRAKAERDLERGKSERVVSPRRSRATRAALERMGHESASPSALRRQTKSAARRRTKSERSAAARKASRTKGPTERRASARKAARTRKRTSR
jgi:hypothetical protein